MANARSSLFSKNLIKLRFHSNHFQRAVISKWIALGIGVDDEEDEDENENAGFLKVGF